MHRQVQILATSFVVYSTAFALIGILLGGWIIFMGGLVFGERDAIRGGIGFIVLALALSLPGLIAGIGLRRFRRWARIVAIPYGVVHLVVFPIGTALGIYTLWVLLTPKTWPLFESPQT